jgi:hypothetical protein
MENATNHNTHFIVGKGVKNKNNPADDQDYYVNDPDSSSNETLSDSEDDFDMDLVKYGIFTPSNTDLSYIVLYINDNVNMKVFDPNGNEILDGYQYDGPLLGRDHTTGETELSGGGKVLKSFYLPKPQGGQYKVEITGNGNYFLESFLYDIDGNVNNKQNPDAVTPGSKNVYLINFNHDTSTNTTNDKITFNFLLQRFDTDKTAALITNNGAYTSIRNMIENAQKQFDKKNYLNSKQFLTSAKEKIQYYASIGGINQTEALTLTYYLQLLSETY